MPVDPDVCGKCSPYADSTQVPWVVRDDLRGQRFEELTDPSWVSVAKRLLRRVPHPIRCVSPKMFAHPPRRLDSNRSRHPDLSIPIVLAQESSGMAIVWDGAHRVGQAMREGKTVPYVLLSLSESLRIARREGLTYPDEEGIIPRTLAPWDATIAVKNLECKDA